MRTVWLLVMLASTSAAAQPWVRAADRAARRALGDDPELRATILAAVTAQRDFAPIVAGGRRFYLRGDGQAARLSLVVEERGATRTLVDDAPLSTFVWPSPDGTRVAYGTLDVGALDLTLHVVEVDGGRERATIRGLRRGVPLVAWDAAGEVLYTVPRDAPRVVAHRAGAAATLFADGDEIVGLARRDVGDGLLVVVRRGDAERVVLVDGAGAALTLVPEGPGSFRYAGELRGAPLLVTTRGAARGRVVRAGATLEEVVAERDAVIETWPGPGRVALVAGGVLAVVYRQRGLSRVRLVPLDGRAVRDVELPGVVWSGLAPSERGVTFSVTGFVDPGRVVELDPTTGALTTRSRAALPYDPDEVVTEAISYTSGAGPAPMLLVRRRDTPRDGARPTLIYGYGYGGWISGPWFRPHLHAWLAAGGLFAVPAIRGGGELGEAWRRAGAREHRQAAIDDFSAAAGALVDAGWTSPRHLVAEGQSVGGGVAAAAVVQRPEAFAALILAHPVLDMLRFHTHPAGRRWIPDFGDPDDPAQRAALRRWSPLHNLARGRCYPPTLVLPSERDATAAPWHGYTFFAALRDAQGCKNPVLLRVAWGADHTYGRDAAETAASYAAQVRFALRATR